MKKIIIYIYLYLVSSGIINSQTIEKHKAIVAGLNNYMEFIHQTTHSEFIFFYRFRNFNNDLVQFSKYPKSTINYSNDNIIENSSYFEILPKNIFHTCLNSKFGITESEKKLLDEHLIKMFSSIVIIQNLNDSIYQYCFNQTYKTDINLQRGYMYLELISNEFDLYISEWKKLVTQTNNIYTKYKFYSSQNPFLRTAKHLDTIFDIVYSIAENFIITDTFKLRQNYTALSIQIQKFEGKSEFFLQGAEHYGSNNGRDPYTRFDMIISDAKAEKTHIENFLKTSKYPNYEENKYGKSYVYYNTKIINKFNRHGLGMAYEYNKMADYSDNLLLKKPQLPHSFKVYYGNNSKSDGITKDVTAHASDTLTLKNAPPNNIIFLLDVSGSMNTNEKLPVLKEAIKYLVGLMRDFDFVTIISFSGNASVLLASTCASEKEKIFNIIDNLKPSGTTELFSGLQLAYKNAHKSFISNGTNKIILATDGNFQITDNIQRIISKNSSTISLSVLYFEKIDSYYQNLLQISTIGNGNCTKVNRNNIFKILVIEAGGQ